MLTIYAPFNNKNSKAWEVITGVEKSWPEQITKLDTETLDNIFNSIKWGIGLTAGVYGLAKAIQLVSGGINLGKSVAGFVNNKKTGLTNPKSLAAIQKVFVVNQPKNIGRGGLQTSLGGKSKGRFGNMLTRLSHIKGLGAAGALLSTGSLLTMNGLPDNAKQTGSLLGNLGGGIGGAMAGAAMGSVVPVVGTAIGGILGGVLGSLGGSAIGETAGGWFDNMFGGDDPKIKSQSNVTVQFENAPPGMQVTNANTSNPNDEINIELNTGNNFTGLL